MHRRLAPPTRLRRRLVVSFVLVAGLSAAALALGSYLLVRESRLDDSVDRSVAQAKLNLAFARLNLPAHPTGRSVAPLLDFYADGGFDTLILSGHIPLGSSPLGLTEADVPAALRTPLTALVSEASLLREHLDRMPPDARRPGELLVDDVGRLRRLV